MGNLYTHVPPQAVALEATRTAEGQDFANKVAAMPMSGGGGEIAARYLRFVFSNEPADPLGPISERVRAALG